MSIEDKGEFLIKEWYLPLILALAAGGATLIQSINKDIEILEKRITSQETLRAEGEKYILLLESLKERQRDHETRVRELEKLK